MAELAIEDAYRRAARRTSLAGPTLAAAAVLITFFGVFGGWTATAPLSGAAVAPGVLRVVDHRQAVQHPEGGVVAEILVRDGEMVEAGQALVRLDATEAEAAVDILGAQLDLAILTRVRLRAERQGLAVLDLPDDLEARANEPRFASLAAAQRDLLQSRHAAAEGEQALLRQRIEQLEQEAGAHRGRITGLERQLVLVRQEAAGVRDLHSRGFAPLTRVVALERQIAALEGDLLAQRSVLAAAGEQIALVRMEMT